MGIFSRLARAIFNPFNADGSVRGFDLGDLQVWGNEVEAFINALIASGGVIYTSKAALDADLAHDAGTGAIVLGDATKSNNGWYSKSGASGTGAWVRIGDLPGNSYILATNSGAGTANAIVATTLSGLPSADGGALVALPIVATNTASPADVAFDGAAALTIKTNSGVDVPIGGLVAGAIVLGMKSGTDFRLLSDIATAADAAAAASAASAAASSASDAATSAATASAAAASIHGLPAGGTTGQVVAKLSATDYDVAWADQTGGASTIITGSPSISGTWHWGGDVPANLNMTTSGGTTAGGVDAGSDTVPEIVAQFGMYSNRGAANSATAYKVSFAPWIIADSGSANAYAMNPVFQANAGFAKLGTGCEIDINNNSGTDYDLSTIGTGTDIHGMSLVSGSGANYTSTAVWIVGVGTKNFSNGISVTGSSTISSGNSSSAAFQDTSNSYQVLRALGTHTFGVNLFGATLSGGYALICPNSAGVGMSNAAGSATISTIQVTSGDSIVVGDGAHNILLSAASGNVGVSGILYPSADNVYPLGTSAVRWSTVYAATGTINTSDPSLKTDIASLPESLPLVLAIDPKTYKWIDGGGGVEVVEEEQEVHATEVVDEPYEEIEERNGKMVAVSKTRKTERKLYDEFPIFDEKGNQLFDYIPARDPVVDDEGNIIVAGRPEVRVPKTHHRPRMCKKKVMVERPCIRPGKRTHWGFMAPDVKTAFDKVGLDFAGYVKGEDGTEHLRPDQMIAVLWKAVQELSTEIESLKASRS